MIAKHSIEQVVDTAKVEEVIGSFINLRRRGVNMIGHCPFHNEKTPSFTVSPAKNIYKCFGCGKGGNAVNFVMEHEGYSYIEAIKFLADFYNITLEEIQLNDEEKDKQRKKDSLFIVSEWAKKRFKSNLFETQQGVNIGLSYFKERGFREATIKKFNLGFAVDDYKDLTNAAQRDGYNREYLEELGLTTSKGNDFFRNRVMFTLHNLTGKAIGFAGRIMGKNPKLPKYINSPESEIYNKRNGLYGLYFAKNEIRKKGYCFLVEGYTDVLSLAQEGIENVVASSGTSLTSGQIRLVKRFADTIKILYDGDDAGINAALRGMNMILAEGMIVKVVILPKEHDPDSMMQAFGPTKFLEYIEENEKDFVLFKTQALLKDTQGNPVKKAQILKEIVETLSKIPDPLMRSMYVKECSVLLDVKENILTGEANKLIKKEIREKRIRERREEERQATDMEVVEDTPKEKADSQYTYEAKDEHQERAVVQVIMDKGGKFFDEENGVLIVDYIISNISSVVEFFDNELYKKIILDVISRREKGELPDEKYYLNNEDEEIKMAYIDLISNPYVYADWSGIGYELQTQKHPDDNQVKEAEQAVLRLNYKKIDKMIKKNLTQLAEVDPESKMYEKHLELHVKILEQKKRLAKKLNIVIQ